jgi:hypothetical protein
MRENDKQAEEFVEQSNQQQPEEAAIPLSSAITPRGGEQQRIEPLE